ncbi:hypothetical protein [Candidatus Mycoplasma haematominutum]|uniref:hypothetical protein n=1 Tax=Candidatus Mycoplasma haematominutum TaxID=209446 RepID=UPI001651AAE9|nr:hypothetical protein [Candidatus Mycoplasma haematominutum]
MGVTGASVVTGVPIISKFARNSTQSRQSLITEGTNEALPVRLVGCNLESSPGGRKINYGNSKTKDVCWRAQDVVEKQQEANELLRLGWNNVGTWAKLGLEGWKAYCRPKSEGGEESNLWISKPSDEACDGLEIMWLESSKSGVFLNKHREGGVVRVRLCQRDCWVGNYLNSGGELNQWASENSNNWREVEFYDTPLLNRTVSM